MEARKYQKDDHSRLNIDPLARDENQALVVLHHV